MEEVAVETREAATGPAVAPDQSVALEEERVESPPEAEAVESPPASGVPLKEEEVIEARGRMNELARELRRVWTRENMRAYLELRRQWR